ncbi:hypothetical protein QUF84_25560 [Fictibacillus enclensis]|uniref:hypothetical protein n=1 Tax=Fictibacillus enclensis TaxID=1017270 RepID=UPI0025A00587|nr:hypothetical protein [Fictibacillus enclensis]MDM5340563.1 hypothetical protein [Fictibacillus enclensis]
MELERRKPASKWKNVFKVAGIIAGAIIMLLIGVVWGSWGAKISLNERKLDSIALEKQIDKQKNESEKLQGELDALEKDISSKQEEKDKVVALIDSRDQVENELKDTKDQLKDIKGTLDTELKNGRAKIEQQLKDARTKADEKISSINSEMDDAKAKLKDLQSNVKSKKEELASLTGQIQKAKGAPKILQAGKYTVGKDLPAGRYLATPVGSGSNFVVWDDGGGLEVNTILGSNGNPSYTFEADDEYTIQTEATVKLSPIQ